MSYEDPRPWIDITHPDYGADPTGAEGDTGAIINKAIDDLPPEGGHIVIPAGTFRSETTIVIDKPGSLRGQGAK